MTQHDLATALRKRQRLFLRVGPHEFTNNELQHMFRFINECSDEDMIDSYVTCAKCGAKSVAGPALDAVIAASKSDDHFLKLSGQHCMGN